MSLCFLLSCYLCVCVWKWITTGCTFEWYKLRGDFLYTVPLFWYNVTNLYYIHSATLYRIHWVEDIFIFICIILQRFEKIGTNLSFQLYFHFIHSRLAKYNNLTLDNVWVFSSFRIYKICLFFNKAISCIYSKYTFSIFIS